MFLPPSQPASGSQPWFLASNMAIMLHSSYRGIQPLIENLKTNTHENEMHCKWSLSWQVRGNACPLCHRHIADPRNMLRHRLCHFMARFQSHRALNLSHLTSSLPCGLSYTVMQVKEGNAWEALCTMQFLNKCWFLSSLLWQKTPPEVLGSNGSCLHFKGTRSYGCSWES